VQMQLDKKKATREIKSPKGRESEPVL